MSNHSIEHLSYYEQHQLRQLLIQQEMRTINQASNNGLLQSAFQVYSQNAEDGIIEEIFRRIGTDSKYFVEIGSSDGIENNTHYLLAQGWKGCWFDADMEKVEAAKESHKAALSEGRISITADLVTPKNVEMLFAMSQVPHRFDLLSIDIDSNDYWVWKAIERYHPRVVVIEYNASLGPHADLVMRYNPQYTWDGGTGYGASYVALRDLGRAKGYNLVACDITGTNAFFVQSELCRNGKSHLFGSSSSTHYQPPRYYLVHRVGHRKAVADWVTSQPE